MCAVGEELRQTLAILRRGCRVGDADDVEALTPRRLRQRSLERGRGQKSRSA
jgi:hypothetical protein